MIFEDDNDELFIHNFKLTKILSPKPIVLDLTLPHLRIEGHLLKDVPLFMVQAQTMKVMFTRNKDLHISVNVWLGTS